MTPAHQVSGTLTAQGHVLPVRVYYEDTDFSGVVYHASYLRFMERGRSDWLRLLGVSHADMDAQHTAFAVRHMDIDFLKPARIDDVLIVRTTLAAFKGARIVLTQTVEKNADVLIKAAVTVAVIDRAGRPQRLADPLVQALGGQNA